MAMFGGRTRHGVTLVASLIMLIVLALFYMCYDVRDWFVTSIPVRLPTTEVITMPTLNISGLSAVAFSSNPLPPPEPRTVLLSSEDKLRIQKCIINADQDMKRGHSTFWSTFLGVPTEHIRWKYHKYLTPNSVIIEIGGNTGIDAEEFIKRYNSKLVTFEPMLTYAQKLKEKFSQNPDVKVFALGLGGKDQEMDVKVTGNDGDSSSMFNMASGSAGEHIIIRNATRSLAQIGLVTHSVDLLHVNCEGCEFDLLEALVHSKMIFNVKNIQFATHPQFSDRVPSLVERYCTLQELLLRSHRNHYQYKFCWESWSLR